MSYEEMKQKIYELQKTNKELQIHELTDPIRFEVSGYGIRLGIINTENIDYYNSIGLHYIYLGTWTTPDSRKILKMVMPTEDINVFEEFYARIECMEKLSLTLK